MSANLLAVLVHPLYAVAFVLGIVLVGFLIFLFLPAPARSPVEDDGRGAMVGALRQWSSDLDHLARSLRRGQWSEARYALTAGVLDAPVSVLSAIDGFEITSDLIVPMSNLLRQADALAETAAERLASLADPASDEAGKAGAGYPVQDFTLEVECLGRVCSMLADALSGEEPSALPNGLVQAA